LNRAMDSASNLKLTLTPMTYWSSWMTFRVTQADPGL
jgi:hypothetical protein